MDTVLFVLVASVACLFQGIVGFGSALIATPILLLIVSPKSVVCSMAVISIALNAYLVYKIKAPIDRKLFGRLFVGALLGLPLGVWVLMHAPLAVIKIAVSLLSMLFTVVLVFTKLWVPSSTLLTLLSGFLSGILTTSVSINGPPVILYLSGRKSEKNTFRRLLVTYFGLLGLLSTIMLAFSGVLSLERIQYGLVSIPFVFVAGLLGDRLAGKVPARPFRIIALSTVFVAGLYGLVTGLLELL